MGVTALLLLPALAGCGSDRPAVHPVEGKVTIGGKPLPGALVVFHPQAAPDQRVQAARALTDVDGVFRLTSYEQNDGAPAGEYAVTVQHYPLIQIDGGFEAGPNSLPPEFAAPTSTELRVSVAEGPNQLPPFELMR